jgi:hypothetical protein
MLVRSFDPQVRMRIKMPDFHRASWYRRTIGLLLAMNLQAVCRVNEPEFFLPGRRVVSAIRS